MILLEKYTGNGLTKGIGKEFYYKNARVIIVL